MWGFNLIWRLYRPDGIHRRMAQPLESNLRSSARDRILDAAEARLLGRGQPGLVLAAVAQDADCSKGGLLYHFPGTQFESPRWDGTTCRRVTVPNRNAPCPKT